MEQTCYSTQSHYLRSGRIGPHLHSFAKSLVSTGYTHLTVNSYIGSVAHFGWWCDKQDIAIEEIKEKTVDQFGAHRCGCPGNRIQKFVSKKYLNRVCRFVNYLQKQGIIKSTGCNPIDRSQPELAKFRDWLTQNRGLSKHTIDRYERLVNRLLPALGRDPGIYNADKIRQVVFKEVSRCSRPQAKTIITALRTYLRFLSTEGACEPNLVNAVPTIPEWRLSSMPRYLNEDSIERLISSCDTSTPHGVRDRAVLLLLSRLALRAGDVAAMCIDDIDWFDGTVRVQGKGRREVRLPLPQDVGDSILEYLENVRPKVQIEKIFLCVNAPYRPFASSASVSDIVRSALCRAGVENAPSKGANLLRHSAATMMLRTGATLEGISAVLRHRSLDMTAYYAKVDVKMLQTVTQPWPGGAPC